MLSVSLNVTGRRLLRERHRLLTTLAVSGTILGTLTANLQTEQFAFGTQAKERATTRRRPRH